MRTIPVDTSAMTLLTAAIIRGEERVQPDNAQSPMRPKFVTDRVTGEQLEVWRVQCFVKLDDPTIEDDEAVRAELLEVVVNGPKPKVAMLDPVEFEGLVARSWEMAGRSGVAFSARSVAKAGAKSRPAPAVPNGVSA